MFGFWVRRIAFIIWLVVVLALVLGAGAFVAYTVLPGGMLRQ